MSARTIVLMGVWSLFMVLVGTFTYGLSLTIYVVMAVIFAVGVGVILLSQRLAGRRYRQRD